MSYLNPEFVEKYQILYEKDPKSKIFAPLAEAYRRMGMKKEALRLAKEGIKNHPNFASGLLTYAKILLEDENYDEALPLLQRSVELAPENFLAQNLLAQTYLQSRRPKEALKTYKMLLLLNPNHEAAQRAVKRLESLSAEDYDDDVFIMENLEERWKKENIKEVKASAPEDSLYAKQRKLERLISLADAFIVRNDHERALKSLKEAEKSVGKHPEIEKRVLMLQPEEIELPQEQQVSRKYTLAQRKIAKLELLLQRISNRKASSAI